MKITIVDVFAERPLAGNQLAVVHDAGALSADTMLSIAREMGFSETTFVTNERDESAAVRIFTPEEELPFAGHPTLGTAWVLSRGRGRYTLELEGGAVPVEFRDELGWMTPPPVELGDGWDPASAAHLVGLSEEQLDASHPLRFARVGPSFVLIAVKDLAALKQASLNEAAHLKHRADGLGMQGVFVFTTDAYTDDADYAARMFFRAGGVREDAATGSANSAFAAYLRALRGGAFKVVVDQGVEMQRPSRLYLDVGETLRVGGKTQLVLTGQLHGAASSRRS